MNKYTIDATGKKLGRVASEAARLLMGKNRPDFVRHKITGGKVAIVNASKAELGEKKLSQKTYARYSGYPGGLRATSMANVIEEKGYGEVFRLAVYGMLPSNKLRPKLMKNLSVKE
ncbi:MAG: 50S ribosomal protein L13 [Candidatus Taylorbacteria bacterium]|nr:50S ribosomal protein L13 [Candidatus Taylorbacteria bacterium]